MLQRVSMIALIGAPIMFGQFGFPLGTFGQGLPLSSRSQDFQPPELCLDAGGVSWTFFLYKNLANCSGTGKGYRGHTGEDWAVPFGTPVYAIGPGQVVFAKDLGGNWKSVVIIKHSLPDGTTAYSQYAHLSKILVSPSDPPITDPRAAPIGNSGKAGSGPHLHLEVKLFSNSSKVGAGPGYTQLHSTPNSDSVTFNGVTYLRPSSFIVSHQPPSTGSLSVSALLDSAFPGPNNIYTGTIQYVLTGASTGVVAKTNGAVPFSASLPVDSYTLSYQGGGPPNAALSSIQPCIPIRGLVAACTEPLTATTPLVFTLQFTSNPPTAGFTMTATNGQSATENQTLTITTQSGGPVSVALDASRSVAFNSTIKSWAWTSNGAVIGSTQLLVHQFPVSATPYAIGLVVTDGRGVSSTAATGTLSVNSTGSITTLESLGGPNANATAINNLGQVVGSASTGQYGGGGATCGSGQCPISYATLWTPGASVQNLSLPPGAYGIDSVATSINSSGQIVGSYVYPAYFGGALLYAAGVISDPLNGVPGGATGINNNGQIVGAYSLSGNYYSTYHAFVRTGSTSTDLSTLGGTSSQANGINNKGQVVGAATLPGDVISHGFLFDTTLPLKDLGTLGGSQSSALAINDSGQVVGWAYTPTAQHGFLYSGSSPLTDLGTLGGNNSQANAINSGGQVVGWAETPSGDQRAFIRTGGQMLDLNSVFYLGTGAKLSSATGINDVGQIAANSNDGHAYRLTLPIPIPLVIMTSSSGGVTVGQTQPFPLRLSAPAPASLTLNLTSDDPSTVSVTPSSVTIAAGATTPNVTPQLNGLKLGSVNVFVSGTGLVPVSEKIRATAIVYSQTAFDASTPNFCMVNPGNGIASGACGPFVSNWFQPTGSPAGKLSSITLKLRVQSQTEYSSWDCYGLPSNCSTPGDFGSIVVYSTQISNVCGSTNVARAINFAPDTWQDVTFTFDSTCPIDFSLGHQLWDIQRSGGPTWGWGVAYSTGGQIYAIIRSQ